MQATQFGRGDEIIVEKVQRKVARAGRREPIVRCAAQCGDMRVDRPAGFIKPKRVEGLDER